VTMANLVHGWSPWLNGDGKEASFINQSRCFLHVSPRSAGTSLMRIRARLIELLVGNDIGADARFSDFG
jgi:hypothetical protein